MAYRKRKSASRKRTTRKRVTKRRMTAPRKRSLSLKATALKTDYARAVLDPKKGPLVGVPQFVPIDTHRARVKAVASVTTTTNTLDAFLNPVRMVANDTAAIRVWDTPRAAEHTATDGRVLPVGSIADSGSRMLNGDISSNAQHASTEFQVSTQQGNIVDNHDGVRARVVGCVFKVTCTTNAQSADGNFIALHEKHHKTLEDFAPQDLAKQSNAIVKRCGSGSSVTLLYRPVKPEEVDTWQTSAWKLLGETNRWADNDGADGTLTDAYPGYMRIHWRGTAPSATFLIEADAIVEYVGEGVTTLARPIGGRNPAQPAHVRPIVVAAEDSENRGGTIIDRDTVEATLDQYAVIAANEQADHTRHLNAVDVTTTAARGVGRGIMADVDAHAVTVKEDIAAHVDARLLQAGSAAGYGPNEHMEGPMLDNVNDALVKNAPEYLKDELYNYRPISVSNNGRHVTWINTETGQPVITARGTKPFQLGTVAEDMRINRMIFAGAHKYGDSVSTMSTDISNAKVESNAFIKSTQEGGYYKGQKLPGKYMPRTSHDVRLVGHSQGGSTIVDAMQKDWNTGVKGRVFNPGVGLTTTEEGSKGLQEIENLVVHRTHTDIISALDHLHKSSIGNHPNPHAVSEVEEPLLGTFASDVEKGLPAGTPGRVETVGIKAGKRSWTQMMKGDIGALKGGHELDQFLFTDAQVDTAVEHRMLGKVGVKRLPRRASIGKALGPAVAVGAALWEASGDMKHEHGAANKAKVGIADALVAASEYELIGAAAAVPGVGLPLALAVGVGEVIMHTGFKHEAQRFVKHPVGELKRLRDKAARGIEHRKRDAKRLWRDFKTLFKHKRRSKRNPYKPLPEDIIGHKRDRDRGEFSD